MKIMIPSSYKLRTRQIALLKASSILAETTDRDRKLLMKEVINDLKEELHQLQYGRSNYKNL